MSSNWWGTNFQSLRSNLVGGLRLAVFLPVGRTAFRVSVDQIFGLIFLLLILGFIVDFISALPAPEFNPEGVIWSIASFLFAVFAAFVVSRLQRLPDTFVRLLLVSLAITPIFFVGLSLLAVFQEEVRDKFYIIFGIAVFGSVAWNLAVLLRVVRYVYKVSFWRAAFLVVLMLAFEVVPYAFSTDDEMWKKGKTSSVQAAPKKPRIDVERTYYRQSGMVDHLLEGLREQRPGVTDLYFVGFAGYGWQDVFMKEVQTVQGLFDERFDTEGRSAVLINNAETVEDVPLANRYNLDYMLEGVAKKMDLEEDVLFLFLTSHASKGHALSVYMPRFSLTNLHHHELAEILDDYKFKWRVIVVSGCYTGGFIDTLKNDHTMVMTASSADRNSFGCSNENDFTYFGRAYFDQALREDFSFVKAFSKAQKYIEEREGNEKITPSLPQIHVGTALEPKLRELEDRFRALHGGR